MKLSDIEARLNQRALLREASPFPSNAERVQRQIVNYQRLLLQYDLDNVDKDIRVLLNFVRVILTHKDSIEKTWEVKEAFMRIEE